jgi:serine/threonine protein kinase
MIKPRKSIKSKQIAEIVIAGKFRLGKKIGNGSFGTVYEGKDLKHNSKVAIKMESVKNQICSLWNEFKILKHL